MFVGKFYPSGCGGASASVGWGEGTGYSVNVAWNGPGVGDSEKLAVFMFATL